MLGRVKFQLLTVMVLLLVTVPSGSRFHGEVEVGVGGISLNQGLHQHLSFNGNQEASTKIHRNYPSLSRWVPPDQPGSAPAFCSSPGNMSPCLVSGYQKGTHTHTHKNRNPTLRVRPDICCLWRTVQRHSTATSDKAGTVAWIS